MSQEVYTPEDFEGNEGDGLLRAETASTLKGVASRESPQIMEYYQKVCEDLGVNPGQDLADMAVRALNDESFANRIAEVEVSLRQARMDNIREDDLEFVQQLQEKFQPEDTGKSAIEQMIEQRLEQQISSPIPRLNRDGRGGGGKDQYTQRLESEVEQLRRKVERMEGGTSSTASQSPANVETVDHKSGAEREGEIDNLFGADESEQEPSVEEVNIEQGDVEVVEEEPPADTEPEPETEQEEQDDGERDIDMVVSEPDEEEAMQAEVADMTRSLDENQDTEEEDDG